MSVASSDNERLRTELATQQKRQASLLRELGDLKERLRVESKKRETASRKCSEQFDTLRLCEREIRELQYTNRRLTEELEKTRAEAKDSAARARNIISTLTDGLGQMEESAGSRARHGYDILLGVFGVTQALQSQVLRSLTPGPAAASAAPGEPPGPAMAAHALFGDLLQGLSDLSGVLAAGPPSAGPGLPAAPQASLGQAQARPQWALPGQDAVRDALRAAEKAGLRTAPTLSDAAARAAASQAQGRAHHAQAQANTTAGGASLSLSLSPPPPSPPVGSWGAGEYEGGAAEAVPGEPPAYRAAAATAASAAAAASRERERGAAERDAAISSLESLVGEYRAAVSRYRAHCEGQAERLEIAEGQAGALREEVEVVRRALRAREESLSSRHHREASSLRAELAAHRAAASEQRRTIDQLKAALAAQREGVRAALEAAREGREVAESAPLPAPPMPPVYGEGTGYSGGCRCRCVPCLCGCMADSGLGLDMYPLGMGLGLSDPAAPGAALGGAMSDPDPYWLTGGQALSAGGAGMGGFSIPPSPARPPPDSYARVAGQTGQTGHVELPPRPATGTGTGASAAAPAPPALGALRGEMDDLDAEVRELERKYAAGVARVRRAGE